MGAFKTKARAIELLGKKQIRDSSTALAELMKNSYDADAEILRVEFLTRDIKVPCVVICDNGCGMNQSDIEDKWLVLGTDSKRKIKDKKSPGGRTLMGEKGIGRLAVSRLGQQMWMFTKKSNTLWNILYINWNIFENPDLFIQDVEVPVIYDIDERDFAETIKKLIYAQKRNLEIELWKTNKYIENKKMIKKQIEDVDMDLELVYDFCDIISKTKNQGTVLFVFNLEDDWEQYLDSKIDIKEDIIAQKNRTRLNSFLSNFGVNEKNFKSEIYLNNEPIELSANFNDDDYEIYDLKIEGTVEKGIFVGSLNARNADGKILDECNEILRNGIPLTAGINNWKDSDCGRYTIKLCHFEMTKKNSGLTEAELKQIQARMEIAGGVSVFRDNVRVLPYGEPENDFLELEARRSKGAGYYLFSHRNMFGRIDITTKENPNLEDKSSREGLLENKYFYYFIKTLQNLLIQIATDFVGDGKPNSFKLRQTYLEHNFSEVEKKEKAKKYEKELQEQFESELEQTKIKLKEGYDKLSLSEKNVITELHDLKKNCVFSLKTGYQELNEMIGMINKVQYSLFNALEDTQKELHIIISEKFEHRYDPEILEDIDMFNEKLLETTNSVHSQCGYECEKLKDDVQKRIQEWILQFEKGTNIDFESAKENLQDAVYRLKNLQLEYYNEYFTYCSSQQKRLSEKADELNKSIVFITDYEMRAKSVGQKAISEINAELDGLTKSIERLEHEDVDFAIAEIYKINEKLDVCERNIYDLIGKLRDNSKKQYDEADKKLSVLLERLNYDDEEVINQLTIGNYQLKEQLEIYADLANLGLAAEIVNHEFNQLFTNVYDAINHIKLYNLPNDVRYYLKQVEVGFRAISDRQNQLSPMYRSKSLRKQRINIRSMIDDIQGFFSIKLEKQNVKLINYVDSDIELFISLSKIYPILSNLIYNSLYWVADQEEKKILFHFVKEENALYVEDSGTGISARNKERVFEPFFSLKKNGRGLGLSLSKNVLIAQGHDIDVVLKSENKLLSGACFRITFNTEDRR
ncbi:ATP-binding protein [Lachnospiraceae bacterium 54-11]